MWEHLPSCVVSLILSFLPWSDRLKVSCICRRWREALYCRQCLHWYDLRITAISDQKKIQNTDANIFSSFTNYFYGLTIEWCSGNEERISDILKAIHHCRGLKCLRLHSRGKIGCNRKCSVTKSQAKRCEIQITSALEMIVKDTSLQKLSFGFACKSTDLKLLEHCKPLSLNIASLSGLGLDEDYFLSAQLSNLVSLTLNSGLVTNSFADLISSRKMLTYLSTLSILISTDAYTTAFATNDRWSKLKETHSKLNVALLFVQTETFQLFSHCVFQKEMPVTSISVIYFTTDCCTQIWHYLFENPLLDCSSRLLELYVHYIESANELTTDGASTWLSVVSQCGNLRQVTITGIYMEANILRNCMLSSSAIIEKLHVCKTDIYVRTDDTNDLVNISAKQLPAFENVISSIVIFDWKASKRVPLQRKYCTVKSKDMFQCILQDFNDL